MPYMGRQSLQKGNRMDDAFMVEQPTLYKPNSYDMTTAISSLSLGGAEKIVVDWASRVYPKWRPHLIILRDRSEEWPVPDYVRVTRLGGKQITEKLRKIGKEIVVSGNPTCVCHLLNREERGALHESGVRIVPVLHNAKEGWLDDVSSLTSPLSASVIAVSQDCALSLLAEGWHGITSIVRHIPISTKIEPNARETFRKRWRIPKSALVIGMIGAVKPQKNYQRALRVLKAFHKFRDAYLVIIGGPVNTSKGRPEWNRVIREINRLGLRDRVAMPGFIPNASECLPAFDVMLNTSSFEGLSIATLESLLHGIPVVASKVGGQGELSSEGLSIVNKTELDYSVWAQELDRMIGTDKNCIMPEWAKFPTYRLWTLEGLVRPVERTGKVLFVTANLNSGGAQRSLVNLTKGLIRETDQFEVAVTGNSLSDHFYKELCAAGVTVSRAGGAPWNAFDYAENIVQKVCKEQFEKVCFWNTNAMIKLLTAKVLQATNVHLIDVSPGDYLYEEMNETSGFQKIIGFDSDRYFRQLDRLVIKYNGNSPVGCRWVSVIPNGVSKPARVKTNYAIKGNPKVVVSGRITPTKYTVEILQAMELVRKTRPSAEVHFFGDAEVYHQDYMKEVLRVAGDNVGKTVFFHGFDFDAINKLADYDIFVVLGKHQGCPNALLEALAVGMPCIGNDDGGTREQITDKMTGLLIKTCDPAELAISIERLIDNRWSAEIIGRAGQRNVLENFSMPRMIEAYMEVFGFERSIKYKVLGCLKSSFNQLATMTRKEQNDESSSRGLH
jgi:glycosyltransferase involved in cell wall biosynthesis